MSDGRARLLLLRDAEPGSAVRGGGACSPCCSYLDRCRCRPPLTRAPGSCVRIDAIRLSVGQVHTAGMGWIGRSR
jgi:hypothetical protein